MVQFEMWYHSIACKKIFSNSVLKYWNVVGLLEVCHVVGCNCYLTLNVHEGITLYLVHLVMTLSFVNWEPLFQ
jgi:hypothetical protein